VVQVRDAAGHDLAVSGVEVTAALTGGGSGQLEGTRTVATDGNGRAQFGDLRITGGTGSYRLLFAAEGFRSATSNKIDVNKGSTTTTISQDTPASDPGQPVTFTVGVTSSSPGTPTGTIEVKASDSEKCTVAAPSGSCQIIFTGTGDRTVTATYSGDAAFATSSANLTHHVNEPTPPPNNPPVASFTHADCAGDVPCQFTDTSTDPDGNDTITSWSWNFGDFGTSTEQNPQHTFSSSLFPYHVTLTVTDNQGASSTTAQDITVP
jgi:PKD repeat protein